MDEQRPTGSFSHRERPPRDDPGRLGTIAAGLIIIAVGIWFFADRTLGLDLPAVDWGSLWPVVLIVVGGWILLGSRTGRT